MILVRWVNRGTKRERRVVAVPPASGVEVIAHRGLFGAAPENTMAAFGAAMGLAHSLELDVHVSADGVPVVIHDSTVDRTSDGTGNVKDLTIAQLEALDFGSWFDATRFVGVKIPRLSDVLSAALHGFRWVYVELKGYRDPSDIELVVQAVRAAGMEERCMFLSFKPEDLATARLLSSRSAVGFLASTLSAFDEQLPLAVLDGNAAMVTEYTVLLANPTRVREARERDVEVVAWPVPFAMEAVELSAIGVTRLISDRLVHGVVPR